jgi:uncharacterized protein
MKLTLLNGSYSIYKFPINTTLPTWVYTSPFYSITKTSDELSVVTKQQTNDPGNAFSNNNWRILKVAGTLDFSLVGIIARISAILKDAGIPIFAISTYDTDYILVKEDDVERAVEEMRDGGIEVENECF